MLTTKINGTKYWVRVEFDVEWTNAEETVVLTRQEPSLRRCDCCDKCMHVEKHYEKLYSFDEAIERGWLEKVDATPPAS